MSATEFLRLHRDPELLTVVNVWDVISARVVADTPGTRALATASHGIAATLATRTGRTSPSTRCSTCAAGSPGPSTCRSPPTSRAGTATPPSTIRRAIGLGIVGANIEDQMKPLAEAARVRSRRSWPPPPRRACRTSSLNARTDAFLRAGDRDPAEVLADAIERTRAYVDAGAPMVFVPGRLDEAAVKALVDAVGAERLTVIGAPGLGAAGEARGARRRPGLLRPDARSGSR